jgi:ATP-dependent helicase Lhr and Lhr-like helicase
MTPSLSEFHPSVSSWFARTLGEPTEPQRRGWPAIRAGEHVLIAAPTGSGKTLAAFLAAIDDLVRRSLDGELGDGTRVLYVSPLKALSNDVEKNLQVPLAGISEEIAAAGGSAPDIRVMVRTGDTSQRDRARMIKRPPHVVVSTPESLYILLTSEGGRKLLSTVETVIVDEIHALVGNRRGAHLALSLERLGALTGKPLQRIGLSATQRPIERVARFLVGGDAPCGVVDAGHARAIDLALELPSSPLEAVMSGEVWQEVYDRLAALTREHRTTLVFVNTRRLAERVTRHLSERLGEGRVTSHHGSLSREQRLGAEQRLKSGGLSALVATASLELGIDIGDVDLVCQIGSPRSMAALIQRVGRSGHHLRGTPKGRLFPLSRDELTECAALVRAVKQGGLDAVSVPDKPLDVLAQQIVAEVTAGERGETELYDVVRRADPYRELSREEFDAVVGMLREGFSARRGRRAAYLHHDRVHGVLRARKGARLTALTSGGAIPDNADYEVLLEPEATLVGTINEDFAIESMAGDIFQLGNASWRILRVEPGKVRVEDAKGAAPTIPFWLGEAPARTPELSAAVSELRERVDALFADGAELEAVVAAIASEFDLQRAAALQLVEHLGEARAALSALPTQKTIVVERFFDETGGMQLVVHSAFGSRINRAWGLSLRKRFCQRFNFELQAAATEDAIVLSLGPVHSFPLKDVFEMLRSETVRDVLIQALLVAPMFMVRWRWNAGRALAVPRWRGGKKLAPRIQRMEAEDLLTAAFPDQVACAENLSGPREVPEHPLVRQTVRDCLEDAMDAAGFEALLRDVEAGQLRLVARDLTEPSALAREILSARPYAFLDDAPLEERRTQAVQARRLLGFEQASDLGALDPDAVERVVAEAWPSADGTDELHDALVLLGFVTPAEAEREEWNEWLEALAADGRATLLDPPGLWVAAERLPELFAIFPESQSHACIAPPASLKRDWEREAALAEVARGRLESVGPITVAELAESLRISLNDARTALGQLESEGFVLRGSFRASVPEEWCERRLLARIHRATVDRLRREIEPVSRAELLRFLTAWQRVTPDRRGTGPEAARAVAEQLEGFQAAAAAWESDLLPARLSNYDPAWLDALCLSGAFTWARLGAARAGSGSSPVRATPIAFVRRTEVAAWSHAPPAIAGVSADALTAARRLAANGACFFEEIAQGTRLLKTQLESALGELVARGLATSDSVNGLRALLVPSNLKRPLAGGRRRGAAAPFSMESAGRFTLLPAARALDWSRDAPEIEPGGERAPSPEEIEHATRVLLARWGVLVRALTQREDLAPRWRDVVRVLRRLEARGEIRGGRFVAGLPGEQYALPEAVTSLRALRKQEAKGELVALSAADPLNLAGLIAPGERVPAIYGNRLLLRDGVPIACKIGPRVELSDELAPSEAARAKMALIQRQVPARLRAYLGKRAAHRVEP